MLLIIAALSVINNNIATITGSSRGFEAINHFAHDL